MSTMIQTAKGSIGQAAAPRRNLNVELATNTLDGAVADLREAIEALEHHLAPLLAPERPEASGLCRERGDSELAERIMADADAIQSRTARLRELIDRL